MLAEEFRKHVEDASFPCVGAKSALATGSLKVIEARDLTSGWNDVHIHRELLRWSKDYRDDPKGLRSLVVIFEGPNGLSEAEFETAMWERIQSFADKDAWLGQPYDSSVSPDPQDPHFSLSFGGCAFFVVGLHPEASRPARRFRSPALVFNIHDQFEKLRDKGMYERMRQRILDRDMAVAGSINPMLSRHGENSEARQYSGRLVGDDWNCPYQDPRV